MRNESAFLCDISYTVAAFLPQVQNLCWRIELKQQEPASHLEQ